jgi:hypothetical protein
MIVSRFEDGWMGFYRERRQQSFTTATGKIAELEDAKLAVCGMVENLVGVAHGATIDPCRDALNEWVEDELPLR